MAKNRNEGNVNDHGGYQEERPYYDDKNEKQELEKVPVEYLGYLERRKESRAAGFIVWTLIIFIIVVIAPGKLSWEMNPRTGEVRSIRKFLWGYTTYTGREHSTDFSDWYYSKTPAAESPRWIPYDHESPAMFGILEIPVMVNDFGFETPDNFVKRMRELDFEIRGGRVMDIPRVLASVNSAEEWNAIVVPLTLDEPRPAKNWWIEHRDKLMDWAAEPIGTPLPQSYIDEATLYVESFYEPEGNEIPLM